MCIVISNDKSEVEKNETFENLSSFVINVGIFFYESKIFNSIYIWFINTSYSEGKGRPASDLASDCNEILFRRRMLLFLLEYS